MTITILCTGALARPGAGGRDDLEPDPDPSRTDMQPTLRNEPHAGSRAKPPPVSDDGAFARSLRRARVVSRSRDDTLVAPELPDEKWLREQFDLDGSVAACVLASSAQPEVVVRPVHLHVGLDHLLLLPPSHLAIERAEAEGLVQAANRWLAEDDLLLAAVRPDAWALRAGAEGAGRRIVAALGTLQAPSARTASGRNIDAWQPSGDAGRRWRQLNNLIQMAWFEHPVNEARERDGRLTVSGPWLEGRAGAARKRPFDRVWTADATVAGLGARSGADTIALDADEMAAQLSSDEPARTAQPGDGAWLLAPGFWQQAVDDGDTAGWIDAWHRFERWFERAFRNPRVQALPLRWVFTGERSIVEVLRSPADRFKPWRSLRLAALLEG